MGGGFGAYGSIPVESLRLLTLLGVKTGGIFGSPAHNTPPVPLADPVRLSVTEMILLWMIL